MDRVAERAGRIDGYSSVEPIGGGGSSTVYRAWQESVRRWVAVKVLAGGTGPSGVDIEREKELHARLAVHPGVVPIFDAGELHDGRPFVTMQLYDGSAQDRLVQDGPLTEPDAVAVMAPVAAAVAAAHALDIVHGDVKPENILLSAAAGPGLSDFGIARSRADGRTAGSAPSGLTPRHAAPEVLGGEAPGEASDVWSLGSTLYTLLAGRPPFEPDPAESLDAFARRARHEAPRAILRRVDAALMDVVLSCLEKEPGARPTAADVRDRMAAIARQFPVEAPPTVAAPFTGLPPLTSTAGSAPDPQPAAGTPAGGGPAAVAPAMSIPSSGQTTSGHTAGGHTASGPVAGPFESMGVDGGLTIAPPERSDRDDGQAKPEPEPPTPRRTRWPVVVAGVAAALLVAAIAVRVLVGTGSEGGEGAGGTGPEATVVVPSSVPPAAVADDLAPTDLVADDFGDTVDLHWTDNADGGLTYIVVYRTPGGEQQTTNVDAGATDITIRGLDPALGYCFRVLGTGQATTGELVQAHADTAVRGCVPQPASSPDDTTA